MIERFERVLNPYWKRVYTFRVNADGSRSLIGMRLVALRPIPYGML